MAAREDTETACDMLLHDGWKEVTTESAAERGRTEYFRNYIHPYSQMMSHFCPDKQTVLICFQVLKAAISQISEYRKSTTAS